jgi:hypothetical protein
MDLQDAKQKLLAVLKTGFDTYWDTLRKFIRSKISKPELDSYVRKELATEENGTFAPPLSFCFLTIYFAVSLHNQLVLSILKNAHKVYTSKVPPRAHPPSKEHKHKLKEKEKIKVKERKEGAPHAKVLPETDENVESVRPHQLACLPQRS